MSTSHDNDTRTNNRLPLEEAYSHREELSRRALLKRLGGAALGVAAAPSLLPALDPAAAERSKAGSRKLTPVTLQLPFIKNIEFSGITWGASKGYYRDQGIDLNVQALAPTSDPITIVAGGNAMFGMASGDELIIARSKGIGVKAFATQMQINPSGWLVLASSGITSPAQFKGKTLGIPPIYRNELPLVLSLEGLSLQQVTVRSVGFDPTALLDHQVDVYNAYAMNQPLTLKAKGIRYRFFYWATAGYVYYTDVFFATDSTIKQHPALLKAFLRATRRGWADVLAHPGGAVNFVVNDSHGTLVAKQQRAELGALRPLMVSQDTRMHGFGAMTAAKWQRGIDLLAKFHLISKTYPASHIYVPGFVTR